MGFLFCYCYSLEFLPDISKWNTNNVKNISGIFAECSSLKTLPDLSKWFNRPACLEKMDYPLFFSKIGLTFDRNKYIVNEDLIYSDFLNLAYIFYDCESLESLPDISKWNTDLAVNIKGMFYNCSNLKKLPDISKWNTQNVVNISELFFGCSSLSSIPDISNWDTSQVVDMSYIFSCCNSLLKIPDISKWKTENVANMNGMFSECSSLKLIPNISNWKTDNLSEIQYFFKGCSSLLLNPSIYKWSFENFESKDFSSLKIFSTNSNSNSYTDIPLISDASSISSINNIDEYRINYFEKNILDKTCFGKDADKLDDYYDNFFN